MFSSINTDLVGTSGPCRDQSRVLVRQNFISEPLVNIRIIQLGVLSFFAVHLSTYTVTIKTNTAHGSREESSLSFYCMQGRHGNTTGSRWAGGEYMTPVIESKVASLAHISVCLALSYTHTHTYTHTHKHTQQISWWCWNSQSCYMKGNISGHRTPDGHRTTLESNRIGGSCTYPWAQNTL